jgi:two-component system, LytTR family, response regulator
MIVDDEPGALNLLEVLIAQTTGWQLVARCYNALEAIAFLKDNEVDLIFMDVNMPLVSGMELASLLPPGVGIVFTTAHSEYAAESYTYDAIDYLLKPVTLRRFLAAVAKIEDRFKAAVPAALGDHDGPGDGYFFIKSGTEHRKIQLNDILYFEGRKEYVRVVTDTFEILTYRRMKDIEAQLPPSFVRVHQSFIVNMRRLTTLRDNHIHIGETRIPIGDKFRESLMEIVRKRTF